MLPWIHLLTLSWLESVFTSKLVGDVPQSLSEDLFNFTPIPLSSFCYWKEAETSPQYDMVVDEFLEGVFLTMLYFSNTPSRVSWTCNRYRISPRCP